MAQKTSSKQSLEEGGEELANKDPLQNVTTTDTDKMAVNNDGQHEEKKEENDRGGTVWNDNDDFVLSEGMKTLKSLSTHPALGAQQSSSSSAALDNTIIPATSSRPPRRSRPRRNSTISMWWLGTVLRTMMIDLPLLILFTLYGSMLVLEHIYEQYLGPQMDLMTFLDADRDWAEGTYYHRVCTGADVTATSADQLVISENTTTKEAVQHMLYHGVSVYPNLISPSTAWALRTFINEENKLQEGWFVIENEFRYSWGIDMNMHPALYDYWKELASHSQFMKALEAIVGPNPAIIEFTAITSSYQAKDQNDHQDVIPPASGAKFARSFIPSYSLFIPLQDSTYEMGATHVCPGSHLCSEGCEDYCPHHNLAMSGADPNRGWPQGWGALMNQQTTHKGMGHSDPTALDRVVLVATFAPRPQTKYRGLETRMIAQGGSYSLKWNHWGHTFYDFYHAATRMTEPQLTLRCLGLLPGAGWNLITVASMRMANQEAGYHSHDFERFMGKGGFPFLPQVWQGTVSDPDSEYIWTEFLNDTLLKTKDGLHNLNLVVHSFYLSCMALVSAIFFVRGRVSGRSHHPSSWNGTTLFFRCLGRLIITHGLAIGVAVLLLHHMAQTNWARNIRNGKSYQLPDISDVADDDDDMTPGTLPLISDVLIAPQYASDFLASYTQLLDVAHPGNKNWKDLIKAHATGYEQLSPTMQTELSRSMVQWVEETPSRFLIQNIVRKWTTITDKWTLAQLCHKELIMASNPALEVLVRQLDSLRADTNWGRWQGMAIHQSIIPGYLLQWENLFVPPLQDVPLPKRQPRLSRMASMAVVGMVRRVDSTKRSGRLEVASRATPPPATSSTATMPQTVEEGDIVEGMYNCVYNEWYRGRVDQVYANLGTVDVVYEDDDMDSNLPPHCVRPFQPYRLGETVGVRDEEGNFYNARVVKVYPDADDGGLYDVRTLHGKFQTMVSPADMRRFD